jgi:oligoendopeptidase F
MTRSASKTPTRDKISSDRRWNLADLFASFDAWEEAVSRLERDVEEMRALEGSLAEGAPALLTVLRLNDAIDERAQLVWWYPALMHDEDLRRNEISARKQRVTDVLATAGTAAAWFRPQLLALSEERVRAWCEENEDLALYSFYLFDLFRQERHVLDEERETLLSYTAQLASSPRDAYSMLSGADAQWPTITLESGEETTLTYSTYHHLLSTSPSQADRRLAYESLYGVFAANKNTYASLYGAVCHRDWFYARSRGYETTLDAALHSNDIPSAVIENLISTTRSSVGPLQRYLRLRQKALGLSSMHLYDTQVPLLKRGLTYPYESAVEHTVESVAPLGESYQRALREAIDAGWIDVYENEGKRSGAYSAPVYGVHPYVLMNYKETRGDMFTLAHEMGHSMHTVLVHERQPYVYSDYTIFVAEVASTLNEGLLLDHLLHRCEEPGERALLLQHAIDSIVATFYTQVLFADFELRAHRDVEAGRPVTADSLSAIYADLMQTYYGEAVEHDAEYALTWARIPHLYRTPYYVYQYATCFASAAAIRRGMHGDHGKETVENYLELLGSGSSSHPMDQLRRAGVDLREEGPVTDVVERCDELVDELERCLTDLGAI